MSDNKNFQGKMKNNIEKKKTFGSQLCMDIDTYAPSKLTGLIQTSTAQCAPKREREPKTAASTSLALPTPSLTACRPRPGQEKLTAKKTGTTKLTHEGRHNVG